ncbi:MAG TPA: DUF3300 domain-containing protein [Candidatus Acidoferrales bacterium]|nr:DUF3300 domain-containing protein [Candidatus Acidoferrales bacterium]
MRKILAVTLALSLMYIPLSAYAASPVNVNTPKAVTSWQDQQDQQYQQDQQDQDDYAPYVPYSPEQLDNLLAPIALYPDPLLAQVLPAATFVDEIDDADRWVRANGQEDIDDQPWDISVKAVAHYPEVLDMMDERLDWTTAVGQAYVNQSTDVMESIQRLRSMAYSQGNLVSNSQWQIVDRDDIIQIWPANPQYIYVPTYDPTIVYYRRPYLGGFFGAAISFGVGFTIGVWLNRDTDWQRHRVYYTGWRGDNDWQRRSRPYIRENNVYINNRVTNITVNRTVINRTVNINNVNNYTSVHRDVNFDNTARNRNVPYQNNRGNQNRQTYQNNQNNRPNATGPGYQAPPVDNRVINRNIDTSNPRLNQFRGHQTPQQQVIPQQAPPREVRIPEQQQQQQQQQRNRATQQVTPQQVRPMPTPPQGPHAFGRTEGNFTPRAASQRGEQSRQQMNRPAPPRPEPSRGQPNKSKPNRPGKPQ